MGYLLDYVLTMKYGLFKIMMLLMLCVILTGCATNECSWTRPIIASKRDTIKTLRQVLEHDKAYKDNCS